MPYNRSPYFPSFPSLPPALSPSFPRQSSLLSAHCLLLPLLGCFPSPQHGTSGTSLSSRHGPCLPQQPQPRHHKSRHLHALAPTPILAPSLRNVFAPSLPPTLRPPRSHVERRLDRVGQLGDFHLEDSHRASVRTFRTSSPTGTSFPEKQADGPACLPLDHRRNPLVSHQTLSTPPATWKEVSSEVVTLEPASSPPTSPPSFRPSLPRTATALPRAVRRLRGWR